MSEAERNGNRRRRDHRVDRCNLRLGNYLIVTEVQAIRCAKARYKSLQNISRKCSEMVGVTTLYQLVEDIKSKDLS